MTAEMIKTFITLAETRSFSRTAEILFISQPTVSVRLKALEDEMKASPNRVRYVNSLSGICVVETVESITYPSTCINPETDKIRKKKR